MRYVLPFEIHVNKEMTILEYFISVQKMLTFHIAHSVKAVGSAFKSPMVLLLIFLIICYRILNIVKHGCNKILVSFELLLFNIARCPKYLYIY